MKVVQMICLVLLSNLIWSKKLIYVQEICRHGARYPLKHSNKGYLPQFITLDFDEGELTSEGKHQHYVLGKIIYDKYWKALFDATIYQNHLNPNMLYVRSTDVKRTIQSAQSQLQGIYSNIKPLGISKEQKGVWMPPFIFNESSKYTIHQKFNQFEVTKQLSSNTIPIHTSKFQSSANPFDEGDYLGKYLSSNCHNQKIWRQQNKKSQEYAQIQHSVQIKQLIKTLSSVTKTKITYKELQYYYDYYQSLKHINLPYFHIFKDEKIVKTVCKFAALTATIFKYAYSDKQIRTANTRLIQNTVDFMRQTIANKRPKLVLLSAHDTFKMLNISCIINHFYHGVQNKDTCLYQYPPFAATIILELWQDNSNHYIKFLYNGQSRLIPVCSYKDHCTFEEFQQWAKAFSLQDPNDQCGMKERFIQLYAIVALLCIILIFLLIWKIKQKKSIITIQKIRQSNRLRINEQKQQQRIHQYSDKQQPIII